MWPGGHREHSTGSIRGMCKEVGPKEGVLARNLPIPVDARRHPLGQGGLTDQLML